ncbi:cyclin-dependent kinase inhibitor 1-like [Lepisosteus oculatus]|uniref:cyclin-dependent kinase inhibitor 1-like n=1 Tax=Lepisosteus oculatus TaxID=7918 RepID=UPI003719FD2C
MGAPPDARQHGEEPKLRAGRGARRNLFGPVDHQQLRRDFQGLLRAGLQRATQRWNFDFRRGRPAEGALAWEELPCRDVPAFYRSRAVQGGRRAEGGAAAPAPDPGGTAGPEPPAGEEPKARMADKLAGAAKRRQTAITDFFAVKKAPRQESCPRL